MIAESAAASAMLAFVLGNRHGLDADHLAAIDGLTRCNASAGRRAASLCGVLFSAGHVGVILVMAVGLALTSTHFAPPQWLAPLGTLISGGTLLLLGSLNLWAATSDAAAAAPVGLRSRFIGPLLEASGAWRIALVGAFFALSFDAVAIAAVFASSAQGVVGALRVGACFAAGMLLVGTANGLWVVRLLRHSRDSSRRAARMMTLTIATVAFAVGGRMLLPLVFEPLGRGLEEYELVVSAGVVTIVLAGYFSSLWIASHSGDGQVRRMAGTADISS